MRIYNELKLKKSKLMYLYASNSKRLKTKAAATVSQLMEKTIKHEI